MSPPEELPLDPEVQAAWYARLEELYVLHDDPAAPDVCVEQLVVFGRGGIICNQVATTYGLDTGDPLCARHAARRREAR